MDDDTSRLDTRQREGDAHVGRAVRALLVFLVVAGTILGGVRWLSAPSPYVQLSSGPVVGIGGKHQNISFTTVDAQRLTWGGYLLVKALGNPRNLVPYALVASPAVVSSDTQQMRAAKIDAAAVATYLVTGKMPTSFYGASVESTIPGLPAAKSGIRPGDIIRSINGKPLTTLSEVALDLQNGGGARVTIGILRGQYRTTRTVTPVWYTGSWKIGVTLTGVNHLDEKALPKPLPTGSIEGPSGGLMFTLAYLGRLTGQSLYPQPIAGTGTIGLDGSVGAIGGAAYKVTGAIAAGDRVFFVPLANSVEAQDAADGKITVVTVGNVGDALTWLCQHGSTNSLCHSAVLNSRLAALRAANP